jgi:uncharacterized membrane protein
VSVRAAAKQRDVRVRATQDAKTRGGRIGLLDTLRGLAVLQMIAYHLCYDLAVIYRLHMPWFFGWGAGIWQKCISLSFLLIAGVCTRYSGRPYRRALKIAGCAALITVATSVLYPDQRIVFGILHCMALSMFVYAAGGKWFARTPAWMGFGLCLLLTAATWHVSGGVLGLGAVSVALPAGPDFLFPLGVIGADFRSADYFPLLPYLFVFLSGSFAGAGLEKLPAAVRRARVRPLTFLGRHSLLLYMVHQPVLMGVLAALSAVFR